MKNSWQRCTLDDCIYLLSGGTPSKQNPEFWNGDIPWVSSKDMYSFRIENTEDSITQKAVDKGAKIIPPGTVLIAVRGMRLQKEVPIVEVQKESSFNQDLKACICKENILSRFLFYWLRANEYNLRSACDEAAHGTKRLQTDRLQSTEINLPPLPTQKRIADILSKYDDLIDNNNRRIALLEESLHRLYREWFVRLRFPGYESVRVVDGVPEGWERTTISNAFSIMGGGTPSKKVLEYWRDGTINWYTPTDLTKTDSIFIEKSSNQINKTGLAKSSARLFSPFSVMMTSRATIGVIAINITEACTNQGFITCLPNQRMPLYFLYCYLYNNVEIFLNFATGTTFKEISKEIFKSILIIIPELKTIKIFEKKAEIIGKQILNLQQQNKKLQEARDSLLPRLINGSIEV